jgi:uncharacterized membrane protein YcaP (DUF421 family)
MILTLQFALPQAIQDAIHQSAGHMFPLPLPLLEKIVRPIIVFLALVLLLRVFGKRELAQLNPFDLVVLLSLSNTVQNAIIGEDNSVTGGIIGAISLLAINWLVARALFSAPKLTNLLEGKATVLVRDGQMDKHAMERESLTEEVLRSVLHREGYTRIEDVGILELEPNGTFNVEPRTPSYIDRQHSEVLTHLEQLTKELAALRAAVGQTGS